MLHASASRIKTLISADSCTPTFMYFIIRWMKDYIFPIEWESMCNDILCQMQFSK
jgi:hypothetical protein